jgi:ribosomal protein S18 acetylase RimI-like enzyme
LEWNGEFTHFRRLYADIFLSTRSGKSCIWIAEYTGQGLIGQLFVQLFSARSELADGKKRAYVYGFRIKPAYRGQGIGTYMLGIVESDLAARNYQYITLNVGQDNQAARRLYERLDYRVIAEDPGRWSYIDDQGKRREVHEPAFRMEKALDGKI